MKRTTLIGLVAFLAIGLAAPLGLAAPPLGEGPPPLPVSNSKSDAKNVIVAFGVRNYYDRNAYSPRPDPAPGNHLIIPSAIKVKKGGVVHFVIGGTHKINIYQPGIKRKDLFHLNPDGTFTFTYGLDPPPPGAQPQLELIKVPKVLVDGVEKTDFTKVFYEGIDPRISPIPLNVDNQIQLPSRSQAQNRVEPVQFNEPGKYLVVCLVPEHFEDNMSAVVTVLP
jgi:plastocyanin